MITSAIAADLLWRKPVSESCEGSLVHIEEGGSIIIGARKHEGLALSDN